MDTDNDLFVFILLVIVMVAIIQTSPDLQTGVLRLSVIVYGVMLYGTSCKTRIKKRKNAVGVMGGGAVGGAVSTPINTSHINTSPSPSPSPINTASNLTIPVEPFEDVDALADTATDAKSRPKPEDVARQLHDSIHSNNYPVDGHIYNTAKNRYTSCYRPPSYEIDQCQMYDATPFDEAVSLQSRARDRSKRSIDGMVSKTMDYYKIHYDREFDKEESKNGWWGDYNYGSTAW
jgi:hypothetical protein